MYELSSNGFTIELDGPLPFEPKVGEHYEIWIGNRIIFGGFVIAFGKRWFELVDYTKFRERWKQVQTR